MDFPKRLKRKIKERGFTVEKFANTLGMTRGGLYDVMKRKTIKPDLLKEICKVLEVDINYFGADLQTEIELNVLYNSDNGLSQTKEPPMHYQTEIFYLKQIIKEKEETLKSKEELIAALKNQSVRPIIENKDFTIPLEIRDLIDQNDLNKTQKFLGNDFYRSSICVSDKFGKIEYVNDEFTNQTGYTIADIRGKSAGEVLQRNDVDKSIKKKMHDALINRTYFEGEVLNYSKSGDPINCKLIIAPIKIKGIEKLISLAVFSKVNVLKYN